MVLIFTERKISNTKNNAPLSGTRILAISQFGAGPFATLLLSDLGAEIIKIEDPLSEGDVGRKVPPFEFQGDSTYFQTFNRGKKSIGLDFRTTEGRKIFEDLVRKSYDVCGNYETVAFLDKLKDIGFDYAYKSGLSIAIDDIHIPEQKNNKSY